MVSPEGNIMCARLRARHFESVITEGKNEISIWFDHHPVPDIAGVYCGDYKASKSFTLV